MNGTTKPRIIDMRHFYPKPPARAFDPKARPRHRIVQAAFPAPDDPGHVWFHTAGTLVLWSMPTLEVWRNPRIIAGMDPMDAFRLGLDHAHALDWFRQLETEAMREGGKL